MWNFAYHSARRRAAIIRRTYRTLLPLIVRRCFPNETKLDLDVFTYSGEATLPEQIASIRSFLKFAGHPSSLTVVSDGSYSRRSISLLRRIDPVVRVAAITEFVPAGIPAELTDYLFHHPTGRQLALTLSLPRQRPALYFDSDVLFFRGARRIAHLLDKRGAAFFLPDCQFAGDERLLRGVTEKSDPVNTGFLLLFRRLDWSAALQRFREMEGAPNFFSNQTLTHLAMHASGAQPLDPKQFVLQLDDQFEFGDRYAGADIVLRHYVSPVRHKFWSALF